jgi:uncharacterized protein (TIGR03382 family)
MKRNAMLTVVMTVMACSAAMAATGVHVEGVFVQQGTQTALTQVGVGQTIELKVKVRDTSDSPGGVIGGLVDVTWNSSVLQLLDAMDGSESTTADVAALFDDPWNANFRGTKLSSASLAGIGASLAPPYDRRAGGVLTDFFTLRFQTLAAGQAGLALGAHGFGVYSYTGAPQAYDVVNPSLTVTVEDKPGGSTDPVPTPSCIGPAMGVAALMAVGFGGLGRRRHGKVGR